MTKREKEVAKELANDKWLERGKGFNGRMCLRDEEKEEVIRKAGSKCEICGRKNERIGPAELPIGLNVHHLRYPPLSYGDLQAICFSCHNKIHK